MGIVEITVFVHVLITLMLLEPKSAT